MIEIIRLKFDKCHLEQVLRIKVISLNWGITNVSPGYWHDARWKILRKHKRFSHYCILTGSSGPSLSTSKDSQDLKSDRSKFQLPVPLAAKKAGRIDFRHSALLS